MNKYEAMFIFPDSLKPEEFEVALTVVKEEIEKAGGKVASATRLGKRAFGRQLGESQDSGYYAVVNFEMEGAKVAPLQARFKLNERIFRLQILRAQARPEETPAAAPTEGADHGVAQ